MDNHSDDLITEHPQAFQDNRLTLGGPLAFSILATSHFLSVANPSFLQRCAIICFAVALPVLAINICLITLELSFKKTCRPWYVRCLLWTGILTGILGTAITFFTISLMTGVFFTIATLLSVGVFFCFIDRLEKINPEAIN
jgi:hypothetical protein